MGFYVALLACSDTFQLNLKVFLVWRTVNIHCSCTRKSGMYQGECEYTGKLKFFYH